MKSIETQFTKLIGAKTPIVAAAMAGASGGALAAEVSLAGGFGFMSTGYDSPAVLQRELDIARGLLKNDVQATMPIGVGFLAWQLDAYPEKAEELLRTTLAARVQAIWLSFGDVARWAAWIRAHDERKGGPEAVKLFIQVSTVPDVRRALNEWDADVIIAQSREAGGHGVAASLPLLTLFPLLAQEVAQSSRPGRPVPPLLAAGGLATGAHVASLLALGAAGVVLGTRFLLSPESKYTNAQRAALLAASSELSVRTMAFDEARGTLGWPEGVDGRGLKNDTVKDFDKGEDIQTIRQKFADSTKADDSSRMVVWAGTGVGFMNEIKPAKEIVKELHEECLACIKRTADSVKDLV